MDKLNALSLGRKIVLGTGILLFIDLFLSWQSVSVGPFTVTRNGWHGFWGVILGLMTVAVVAWVAARAFGVELPAGVPDGLTTLVLGGLILVFAILKNLTDDYSAWASYVGIVIAAGLAYGAWLTFQDSGEEMPRFASSGGASSGSSSAPTPPPTPPESGPPAAE